MSDLSELFERDPLKLTQTDIEAIVTRMRQSQTQYELAPAPKAAAASKTPKTKTAADPDILKKLGLI